MKFKSISEDGLVEMESSLEEKEKLVEFLNHFFVKMYDKKIECGINGQSHIVETKDWILSNTEAGIRNNIYVEDLIEKIKPQMDQKNLLLVAEDIFDIYMCAFSVIQQTDITVKGYTDDEFVRKLKKEAREIYFSPAVNNSIDPTDKNISGLES